MLSYGGIHADYGAYRFLSIPESSIKPHRIRNSDDHFHRAEVDTTRRWLSQISVQAGKKLGFKEILKVLGVLGF